MGHQACGALDLWNYPIWMRNLIPQDPSGHDRPDHVDMPALESKNSLAYKSLTFKVILKSVKFWVLCNDIWIVFFFQFIVIGREAYQDTINSVAIC